MSKDYSRLEIEKLKNINIYSLFKETCNDNADDIAVIFESKKLTYNQVLNKVEVLSNYLESLKISRGTIIGVYIKRSEYIPIIFLTLLKLGYIYLPLDIETPIDRINNILLDSGCKFLITEKLFDTNDCKINLILIDDLRNLQKSKRKTVRNFNYFKTYGSYPVYLIYTSGSTGNPKGVLNNNLALINRILWMKYQYNINTSDNILHKTSISFDVSIWEILLPLVSGSTLLILKDGDQIYPDRIIDYIKINRISVIHFVPTMLEMFLEYLENTTLLPSLKHVFCSGEALSKKLVSKFFIKFKSTRLHNLYGPTEAAIDVTYFECSPNDKEIYIGNSISNVHILILDKNFNYLQNGKVGQIAIGGVAVSNGYINRKDKTNSVFVNLPTLVNNKFKAYGFNKIYLTGDIGKFENGNLKFLGRKDQQYKIRGNRIELFEIEFNLNKLEYIRESVVFIKKINQDLTLIAAITLEVSTIKEISSKTIQTDLSSLLPKYMIPQLIIFYKEFPKNSSGKIDRTSLLKLISENYEKL